MSSSILGSVFLGDGTKQRVMSSPTSPPTSPSAYAQGFTRALSPTASTSSKLSQQPISPPPPIDPELSLELRIRWLESLLIGMRQDASQVLKNREGETLIHGAEEVQKRLDSVVENNDALRKFVDRYDQHADILTPAFALSGSTAPPSYSSMSSQELDAYLTEMETDIRAADRDLREIDSLERHGVLTAGKLPDYQELQPRLKDLKYNYEQDVSRVEDLERRIASVLKTYATRIDALSELFVEWNDDLISTEDRLSRLEKEKKEKIRLGLES